MIKKHFEHFVLVQYIDRPPADLRIWMINNKCNGDKVVAYILIEQGLSSSDYLLITFCSV